MTIVTLTPSEIQMASFVGCQRATENIKNGDIWSRSGEPPEQLFDRMIKGALAEAAFAKHFNRFWSKGTKGASDVDNMEVRCTHYDTGHMEMHKWDKDDSRYYLLTGMNGTYKIRGWILGKDAKKPQYWRVMQEGRKPQYWIPQSALNDNIYETKEKNWLDD
jgi:hypothetical protein